MRKRSFLIQIIKDFRPEAFYCASESTQSCATMGFFLSLFPCNFDDQLSPYFHRFDKTGLLNNQRCPVRPWISTALWNWALIDFYVYFQSSYHKIIFCALCLHFNFCSTWSWKPIPSHLYIVLRHVIVVAGNFFFIFFLLNSLDQISYCAPCLFSNCVQTL